MIRFGSRVDVFLPVGAERAGAASVTRPAQASRWWPNGADPAPRQACAGARMRQVVVVMPSAFTLGNLFFGFWAIVSAFNGNFRWAGWFIVFAGILDMLDGRVARLSNTGTRFGAELDSLVDVISFGVAPALLIYFLDFSSAGPLRLDPLLHLRRPRWRCGSRGSTCCRPVSRPTGWFTGLPSPAAGMTLAVYYPFSQTEWYRASLAYLDLQHQGLVVLMLLLAVLMVSNVKYPKFPPIGFRSAKGLFGLAVHLIILLGGILAPEYFLFPLGLFYMAFGIVRAIDPRADGAARAGRRGEERLADGSERGAAARHPRAARQLARPPPDARGPMSYRVHVRVMPRAGLLDPQGQAVEHALAALGFAEAGDVRVGRAIELEVAAPTRGRGRGAGPRRCATSCSPIPSPRTTCSRWRSA